MMTDVLTRTWRAALQRARPNSTPATNLALGAIPRSRDLDKQFKLALIVSRDHNSRAPRRLRMSAIWYAGM
jgi:hypothetical protein